MPAGTPTAIVCTSARVAWPSVVVMTVTPANWNTSFTTTPWPRDQQRVHLQRERRGDLDRQAAQVDVARDLAGHAGGGDDERAVAVGEVQADVVGLDAAGIGFGGIVDAAVGALVAEEERHFGEGEPHDLGAGRRSCAVRRSRRREGLAEDADLGRVHRAAPPARGACSSGSRACMLGAADVERALDVGRGVVDLHDRVDVRP